MSYASSKKDLVLEPGKNEVELIEFYVDGQSYAVNISKVLRVIALSECTITPVADGHEHLAGVTHIEDNPVPVVDLSLLLKGGKNQSEKDRRLLLVLEFNQRVSAYLIDGVNKIHRTAWSNYKPTSHQSSGKHAYISGTVRLDDHVILFLDIEQLLSEFFPEAALAGDALYADKVQMERRAELHLVFVEDSQIIRKKTGDYLRTAGFKDIHVCENGKVGRDYMMRLKDNDPERLNACMVVTDVEMPEMDGLTLCRLLKEYPFREYSFPVVIYSSLINKQMKKKCDQVHADATVAKPNVADLVQQLDSLLDKVVAH